MGYRDPTEALEHKLGELEAELDRTEQAIAARRDLERRRGELEREIRRTRHALAHADGDPAAILEPRMLLTVAVAALLLAASMLTTAQGPGAPGTCDRPADEGAECFPPTIPGAAPAGSPAGSERLQADVDRWNHGTRPAARPDVGPSGPPSMAAED